MIPFPCALYSGTSATGSHPDEQTDDDEDGFAGATGRILHYPNVLAQSTAAPSDTETVDDVIQQRIQDGEGFYVVDS